MSARVYDGASLDDISQLARDIALSLEETTRVAEIPVVEERHDLFGISEMVYRQINASLQAGKRHFILYGPPGTGKTTLAQHLGESLSSTGEYVMLTASSAWSSQDLIGGYQPIGSGEIEFVPGAMLQNFDKPVIIDELNRSPIDKVLGPLFSVLSNQSTKLPYRMDVSDSDSPFYSILPSDKGAREEYEFCPQPSWRIVCTLNTVDKSSLGQISYALARRFTWIKIGVPEDLVGFVFQILTKEGLTKGKAQETENPVATMWSRVNKVREIGGAPIIDFIKIAHQMKTDIDFQVVPGDDDTRDVFLAALRMFFLPLLDGIQRSEANQLKEGIASAVGFGEKHKSLLGIDLDDIAL
jgi:5-methylcytosine-specific restriction enzyme B